jgi:hypothetical protein
VQDTTGGPVITLEVDLIPTGVRTFIRMNSNSPKNRQIIQLAKQLKDFIDGLRPEEDSTSKPVTPGKQSDGSSIVRIPAYLVRELIEYYEFGEKFRYEEDIAKELGMSPGNLTRKKTMWLRAVGKILVDT